MGVTCETTCCGYDNPTVEKFKDDSSEEIYCPPIVTSRNSPGYDQWELFNLLNRV